MNRFGSEMETILEERTESSSIVEAPSITDMKESKENQEAAANTSITPRNQDEDQDSLESKSSETDKNVEVHDKGALTQENNEKSKEKIKKSDKEPSLNLITFDSERVLMIKRTEEKENEIDQKDVVLQEKPVEKLDLPPNEINASTAESIDRKEYESDISTFSIDDEEEENFEDLEEIMKEIDPDTETSTQDNSTKASTEELHLLPNAAPEVVEEDQRGMRRNSGSRRNSIFRRGSTDTRRGSMETVKLSNVSQLCLKPKFTSTTATTVVANTEPTPTKEAKKSNNGVLAYGLALIASILIAIIIAVVITLMRSSENPAPSPSPPAPGPSMPLPTPSPQLTELKYEITTTNKTCIHASAMSFAKTGNRIAFTMNNPQTNTTNQRVFEISSNLTMMVQNIINVYNLDYMQMALSGDGLVLATTSLHFNNITLVHTFRNSNAMNWDKYGNEIPIFPFNKSMSLSLSYNGDFLAIGNPYTGIEESGFVSLYYMNHTNDATWQMLSNQTNVFAEPGDHVGSSVGLSSDGMTFAYGSPFANYPQYDGSIAIHKYLQQDHDFLFLNKSIIYGPGEESLFGLSISLSSSGNEIAVGASGHSIENKVQNGICEFYQYKEGQWTKKGNSIVGENDYNFLGYQVAISGDGKRVAIAQKNPYKILIFEFSSNNWGQVGSDITHDEYPFLGSKLYFNMDGSNLAVAADQNNHTKCGSILYYNIETNFTTSI